MLASPRLHALASDAHERVLRRPMRLLPALAVILASVGTSAGAWAVHGSGDDSTPPLFPQVVYLDITGPILGANCSGVLITPNWVITNRHCFLNSGAGVGANVTVSFGFDMSSGSVQHTPATSGNVTVMDSSPIPGGFGVSDGDTEDDLAAFRLDQRVARSLGVPAHPPQSYHGCGDDFEATIVGYGGEDNTFCGDQSTRRRFSKIGTWSRYSEGDGAYFETMWDLLTGTWLQADEPACDEYEGADNADSGGGFFKGTTLCGLHTFTYWYPLQILLVPYVHIDNRALALDSSQAIAFLDGVEAPYTVDGIQVGTIGIKDIHGNFDGECPAYVAACQGCSPGSGGCSACAAAEGDADSDGVIDACDSCVNVYNPEQLWTFDDPDGDGVGTACDNCWQDYNLAQENCNLETELAVAYPGLSAPPGVSGPPPEGTAAYAAFQASLLLRRTAFTGDACDDVPCMVQIFDNGGSLPNLPVTMCTAPGVPKSCNCHLGEICEWDVQNRMHLAPRSTDGSLDGEQIQAGERWCPCKTATYTPEQRALCYEFECPVSAESFYNPPWQTFKSTSTKQGFAWPGVDDQMWDLKLLPAESSSVSEELRWDFRTLTPATKTYMPQTGLCPGPGPCTGLIGLVVNGILTSKVLRLGEWNVDVKSWPYRFNAFGQTFAQGKGSAILSKDENPLFDEPACYPVPCKPGPMLQIACDDCPLSATYVAVKPSNPVTYVIKQPGMVSTDVVTQETNALYQDALAGELLAIDASEPVLRQKVRAVSSQPMLRSVFVESSGEVRVTSALETTADGTLRSFTPRACSFVTTWGTYGGGDGQFDEPLSVAADADGSVYVGDRNDRVQKFTGGGEFLLKWGSAGSGDGEFEDVQGISLDFGADGSVYVADAVNNRIQKFTTAGQFLLKWGQNGSADGEFNGSSSVAVSHKTGDVYVLDSGNFRVQRFSAQGDFLGKWGSFGAGPGELSIVTRGIAVDPVTDDVFVCDTFNHRIERFTSSGAFVRAWGSEGTGDAQFADIVDIEVDAAGLVYVADKGNDRVQVFTREGTFRGKFGHSGDGEGEFYGPNAIAIDRFGNLFVSDSGNHRIQAFVTQQGGGVFSCSPEIGHFKNKQGPLTNEGIVLSGTQRWLFVVGGTIDGTLNGAPNSSAWRLDIPTSQWQEFPVAEEQRPGAVLASTYRLDDGNVYLVDRIGSKTRLRRWTPPDGPVEIRATFPVTWQSYDRSWLVAGNEGDLLFAATRTTGSGAKRTVLARFEVGEAGDLSFQGVKYLDETLLGPPIVGHSRVQIIIPHSTGAKLDTVPLTSFGSAPAAQMPIVD